MAQASNYQEKEAGSSLDDDIERLRAEFDVEICRSDGDPESDLHRKLAECKKNPGHVDFIPEPEFTIEHLPVEWRDPLVYRGINMLARHAVHLSVFYTSRERPDGYWFSKERGQNCLKYGTGYAYFPSDYRNKQPQRCPIKDCVISHPHNVTPEFYVNTATHVVFDSSEAEQTLIRFFFNSKDDTKGEAEVTAQGLRNFQSSGVFDEACNFTCVSHDLNKIDLCLLDPEERELNSDPEERELNSDIEPPLRDTNSEKRKPLVVIISYPHGCSKHISTGYWTGVKSMPSDFLKVLEEMPFRNLFPISALDTPLRQFLEDLNMNGREFLVSYMHDVPLMLTFPFTLNEITHKMLLAMWEKTTSNSTFRKQVSEEELTEIALSVVSDVTPLKSSYIKGMICKGLLSLWKKLTSDLRFSRQPCREEFNEICKHVVDDIFGTNSLTLKEMFEKMCSLLSMPAETFLQWAPTCSLFNGGERTEDEDNPFLNMTAGEMIKSSMDMVLKYPLESLFDRMVYSTPTCPGSSGAPVLIYYDKDEEVNFGTSLHCGAGKRTNISCHDPPTCSLYKKVKPTDKLKQEASQDDIKPTEKRKQEASQDDIKPTEKRKQEASQDDIKPTEKRKQEASQDDIPLD